MDKEFLEKYEDLMAEDVELALDFCEKEVGKATSPDIYIYIGDCLLSLNEYDEAISSIDKALNLGCKNIILAKSLKGEALFYLGKYKESKEVFIELLKENPNSFFALAYLTDIDINLKNYEEGVKRALKAINSNSLDEKDTAYILANVGWINLKYLNNETEALKLFKKALSLDSNLSSAYIGLGEYYLTLKDYNNALKNYETALDLGESTIDVFLALGLCFKGLGRLDDAKEYFTIVYNADSTNEIAAKELKNY